MTFQIAEILKKPAYAVFATAIALLFAVLYLFFDQFLFFAPYLVFYLESARIGYLALDLIISALSGILLSLSLFQLFNISKTKSKGPKLGLAGILVAFFSGACPCYYLVPLLAVAGGAGGTLAFIGITLDAYQVPVKIISLALMAFVLIAMERSLRASCRLDLARMSPTQKSNSGARSYFDGCVSLTDPVWA
jgi:hypothetical protein